MSDPDKKKPPCVETDSVRIGPNIGGVHPYIRHRSDHGIETGFVSMGSPPPESGLKSERLFLKHREGAVYDVLPMAKGGSDRAVSKGPSQVNSPAYRAGWDNIFSKKPVVGQA